jgi:hypothetical protein
MMSKYITGDVAMVLKDRAIIKIMIKQESQMIREAQRKGFMRNGVDNGVLGDEAV